jgi:hypothetical protein
LANASEIRICAAARFGHRLLRVLLLGDREAAQKANEYDLGGHAAKAKALLSQASDEIKLAGRRGRRRQGKRQALASAPGEAANAIATPLDTIGTAARAQRLLVEHARRSSLRGAFHLTLRE